MYHVYAPTDSALGDVVGDAVAWIKSKLQDWYTLPARIRAARERAAKIAAIAAQQGKTTEAQKLRDAGAQLQSLDARHSQVTDRLRSLIAALGSVGVHLGVIPVAVLALAATVAGAMALVMASVKKQEDLIDAVAKGVLTPEQAAALGKGPLVSLNVPWLVPAVVLAGVGLWWWRRRQ
jgi:hypothetical protein